MAKFNPFANATVEEKEAMAVSLKEAADKVQAVKNMARKCLALPEFQEYRERYEKAEKALVKVMLKLDNPDPIKKVLEFTELQAKLSVLGSLLADVTKDAK